MIKLKPYTVACRQEYDDGHDFVQVMAKNAWEALPKAKKQYAKIVKESSGEEAREIYTEYLFEGHITCAYNEYGFGATEEFLKSI